MFQTAALEVGLEFPVDMGGQGFALGNRSLRCSTSCIHAVVLGQLVDQRRVVRFDELVEKCLLGLMPFVGNVAKALPALCQHASSAQKD